MQNIFIIILTALFNVCSEIRPRSMKLVYFMCLLFSPQFHYSLCIIAVSHHLLWLTQAHSCTFLCPQRRLCCCVPPFRKKKTKIFSPVNAERQHENQKLSAAFQSFQPEALSPEEKRLSWLRNTPQSSTEHTPFSKCLPTQTVIKDPYRSLSDSLRDQSGSSSERKLHRWRK